MMRGRPQLRVRAATEADLAACAEIFAAGQREIEPDAAEPTSFTRAVAGEQVLVAVAPEGSVVAFLSLWRPDRFVHFLHVRPDWRRQGAARLLLRRARQTADGPLELKCLPGNMAALACYRRLGWNEVERHGDGPAPFVRLRQPA